MPWWWSASPASKPSESPTASKPGSSQAQIASDSIPDKSIQSSAQGETVEQSLSQYMPIFAESSPQSETSTNSQRKSNRPEDTFENLYPETMSCREAFDQAMHCRGPGGQVLNLYRYGEFRQCSEQWSQFWFCMRLRTKPVEVKRQLIREFYREKDLAKYADKPSSEDIWQQRAKPLERAFDEDLSQIDELPLEDTRLRTKEPQTS